MEDISVVWYLVGFGVLVFGPAGGVWAAVSRGEKILSIFVQQMKTDRTETQDWLKNHEERISDNTTEIAVLDERTKGAA